MLAKDKRKLRHFLSLYLRWSELRNTNNRNDRQEKEFDALYFVCVRLTSKEFMGVK